MAKRRSSARTSSSKREKKDAAQKKWEEFKRKSETSRIALVQLNLGRAAQMYGIYAALSLALNAFLATVGGLDTGFRDLPLFRDEYFLWLISLTVSFILSIAVVFHKANYYPTQMRSFHFALSVSGVVISILFIVLVIVHATGLFVLEFTTWLYPVSVLGMSLALISIALTWGSKSSRRTASIICALIVPIFFIPPAFTGLTESSLKGYLVMAYLFAALAIELSGSLLLIIATATKAHEQVISKAGDMYLNKLRGEYEQRIQAVDYKEKAVRAQESIMDTREAQLRELEEEIMEKKRSTDKLKLKIEGHLSEFKELQRQLAASKAEASAKVEEMALRNKALEDRQSELNRLKDELAKRESGLLERDKELKRKEIDVTEALRKSEQRIASASETEKRAKTEMEALEKRRHEIIQQEKDIELRESDVRMRIERLEAVAAKEEQEKMREYKDLEEKLRQREKELGKLEVELRKLEKDANAKAEENTRADAEIQKQRLELSDKEEKLIAREKQISDLETTVAQRSKQIEEQLEGLKAADERVDMRQEEYAKLFKSIKEQEETLVRERDQLKSQIEEVEEERQKAKTISMNLSREVKSLNEKYKKLQAKEKDLEHLESDLQLRSMSVDKRESAMAKSTGITDVDEERDKAFELREKRLREREEEFRRRMYQKEKEFEALEVALKEKEKSLAVAAGEEIQVEEVAVEQQDKLKTGIARLDDLLYGGIRMNTNVALVGPAFAGKEVLAYNFIAEGLKKGIPAIVVTTTKPPVELAKDIAPILPSFLEYDHLGLVKWIDASGRLPPGSKPMMEGSKFRVNGATDFENIISIIESLDSEFKEKNHPYFRLVYMTLSSSVTHTDENKALGFVQQLVNRLRQTKAVSFMTMERGMHTEQQVESIEHLMDGAIRFKVDQKKSILSVIGIGEVQTREWIGYKFTNKTLIIGAFALERIK